ncbi:MAG: nucleotide sugar dehydrogenase [Myxococcota bacterium]
MTSFDLDVAVIGGAGRIGLPLSLLFADCGLKTLILDIDAKRIEQILEGRMPFAEEGAQPILSKVLANSMLHASTQSRDLSRCRFIVCVLGTPVDEHMNPSFDGILRALRAYREDFRHGQTVVLRSTLFPGSSARIRRFFEEAGLDIGVAFCPERVAQGVSLRECRELPQIISAFDRETLAKARWLFSAFASEFIELLPMEAELCKLMTNSFRYVQFATVNQFYMIAQEHGVDFQRVLHGCRHNYPRMAGMPRPGMAAGPCLVKDTMQLAAFSHNSFPLGHAAMLVNEGLPAFLVAEARKDGPLSELTVGVLGLAFKAGSDDRRDSLSYKLIKLLQFVARRVLRTDPFVDDPEVVPLEKVLAEADVLFVATPHEGYRGLRVPPGKRVYDPWSWLAKAAPAEVGSSADCSSLV